MFKRSLAYGVAIRIAAQNNFVPLLKSLIADVLISRVNNLYIEESVLLSNASVETRSVKL